METINHRPDQAQDRRAGMKINTIQAHITTTNKTVSKHNHNFRTRSRENEESMN